MKTANTNKKRLPIGWLTATICLSVFSIGLIVGVVVLFGQNHSLSTQLENNYQNAFFDVVASTNDIEVGLSKLLACGDDDRAAVIAGDVWQVASRAEASLNHLPSQRSLTATTKFLNQVGDYSHTLAERVTLGGKLTEEDFAQIKSLYGNAREIKASLERLASGFVGGFRISEQIDQPGWSDTYSNIEQGAVDYPEMIYDGPFSDGLDRRQARALTARTQIDDAQAKEIARTLFGQQFAVIGHSEGAIKTIDLQGDCYFVGLTRAGGLPVSVVCNRYPDQATLTEKQARQTAEEIARALGYDEVSTVWYNSIGSVAYLTLAPIVDDVVFYADIIKIKLALDNGELLGLDGREYVYNHHNRAYKPVVSEGSARHSARRLETIDSVRLAVVPHGNSGERLAYELTGAIGDDEFIIYVDAQTAKTLKIFRVIEQDQGKMTI